MQRQQLEPPVERVGHAALGKEYGLARLLDDQSVGGFGGFADRLAPGERYHRRAAAIQVDKLSSVDQTGGVKSARGSPVEQIRIDIIRSRPARRRVLSCGGGGGRHRRLREGRPTTRRPADK